jgi:hypothetical protein
MPSRDAKKETGADSSRALAGKSELAKSKLAIEDAGMSSRPPPPTCPWVTDKAPGEWSPFFFQVQDEEAEHRERGVPGPGMGKIQGRLCRTQKISARMGPDDSK